MAEKRTGTSSCSEMKGLREQMMSLYTAMNPTDIHLAMSFNKRDHSVARLHTAVYTHARTCPLCREIRPDKTKPGKAGQRASQY